MRKEANAVATEWRVIESEAASNTVGEVVAKHLKEKKKKKKLGRNGQVKKRETRLAADLLIECIKGSELPC